MPRNRYTKLVRISERAQVEQQIEEMAMLAWSLARPDTDSSPAPAAGSDKTRRRTRREQNQHHTMQRSRAVSASQP
jgi:hypothetical protein